MSDLLSEGLKALGIDHLSCAVHDRCLPPDGQFDLGCGAPGSAASADFTAFIAELGFNALQLGPPGEVSAYNLSPYDGTVFSRSTLQLAWGALVGSALEVGAAAGEATGTTDRCDYSRAFADTARRLAALHERWDLLERTNDEGLAELRTDVAAFRHAEQDWLEAYVMHDALSARYGGPDASRWSNRVDARLFSKEVDEATRDRRRRELLQANERALTLRAREQFLLWAGHRRLVHTAHALGLEVWADLQVGLSHADHWAHSGLMLEGYLMGAPPSRTNPAGQPWGYPVFNPAEGAGADAFRRARATRLFRDYDGVRIDHPHGLVCPWVYRDGSADAYEAVRDGARLFSVGGAPRHAPLSALDIARLEQLDLSVKPWADGFVTSLDDAQVERYSHDVDLLIAAARADGKAANLALEVLSTMPYPLGRVLARHGLGRFRVTQKADVTDAEDVYLPANAVREDWLMVGTHDTPTIWRTATGWTETVAQARLEHAVARLAPDGVGREALRNYFGQSRRHLALAELALLFTTAARHVLVWVFDLLGAHELYNRPGVIHPDNWTLRVPAGFRELHSARVRDGAAFEPCAAIALALAARPFEERQRHRALITALAARASGQLPGLAERLA